jgi:ribose 5-phosphate isomerase RpiB
MKIAIGSDHAGFALKEQLRHTFEDVAFVDCGTFS